MQSSPVTSRREGARVELEPAAVHPAQVGAVAFSRGANLQPEKRLMLAVLEDAVTIFLRECARETTPPSRELAEVLAWLKDESDAWPFSFVAICRALALEPSAIRRGLCAWRTRRLALPAAQRTPVRSPFRRMNGTRTKTRSHAPGLGRFVA